VNLPTEFVPVRGHPLSSEDVANIEKHNTKYRHVFYTHDGTEHDYEGAVQDVAMALGYDDKTSTSLGAEVHHRTTQYFAVADGMAIKWIGPSREAMTSEIVRTGQRWTVPPGWWHDVERVDMNIPFRLFVQYSPPHHPPGRQDATRASAEQREEQSMKCAYQDCGALARFAPYDCSGKRVGFCTKRHQMLYYKQE